MTKRRWIQDPKTHELIEVGADYKTERRGQSLDSSLWGDRHYENVRGPNGEDLSSRAKHRAFLRSTGLATTDDFKSSWAKAQEARDHYRQNGGSVKASDVRQAIERLKRQ